MRRPAFGAARLARVAALAALSAIVFEACTTTDDTSVAGPTGPASIDITGSTAFACTDTLAVTLTAPNWNLRSPGACGTTPQCGTARVSLIAPDGTTIAQRQGTSLSVVLALSAKAFAQVWNQVPAPTLRAELIDDAGNPFVTADGGLGSVEKPVSFMLTQGACAGELGAGGGTGAGGAAQGGAASTSTGEGGAAGALGSGGSAGTAPEGGAGGLVSTSAGAAPI